MEKKYYTYIHVHKNKVLGIGVGTYYSQRKTHKQRYERAYQRCNRGYKEKGINHLDVDVLLFGNFDTKKEAEMYETHLHNSVRKGVDLIRNRDKSFNILSQSQEDVYKSLSKKRKKKVRCVTTGQDFNSIGDASKEYNIYMSRISENLKGKRDYCKHPETKEHLKFEYIE